MKKHRGEIVEEVVRRSGFPITRLAERLKISRNTLYNRFRSPDLSYEFISAVSDIIHYNFSLDFPELIENETSEGSSQYTERNTIELLRLERKYRDLLERYNKLLVILATVANTNELETLKKEITRFLEDKPD